MDTTPCLARLFLTYRVCRRRVYLPEIDPNVGKTDDCNDQKKDILHKNQGISHPTQKNRNSLPGKKIVDYGKALKT